MIRAECLRAGRQLPDQATAGLVELGSVRSPLNYRIVWATALDPESCDRGRVLCFPPNVQHARDLLACRESIQCLTVLFPAPVARF